MKWINLDRGKSEKEKNDDDSVEDNKLELQVEHWVESPSKPSKPSNQEVAAA